MRYDIQLKLHYDYDHPVVGGRQLLRVQPSGHAPHQRVIASSLSFEPDPDERIDRADFFGTPTTTVVLRSSHDRFEALMRARVHLDHPAMGDDRSATLPQLAAALDQRHSMTGDSPHHFLGDSPLAARAPEIEAYAAETLSGCSSVRQMAGRLCHRIWSDFAYEGDLTSVDTSAQIAFALRKGVCQDFAHVMIAGLRSQGIPAAYVSGYLRTIPPPGEERMEGADAMHAWVRVFCGGEDGWIAFDPTNDMIALNDHIVVGQGRDYLDVLPIVGVLKMTGPQSAGQAVDVIPLDDDETD